MIEVQIIANAWLSQHPHSHAAKVSCQGEVVETRREPMGAVEQSLVDQGPGIGLHKLFHRSVIVAVDVVRSSTSTLYFCGC